MSYQDLRRFLTNLEEEESRTPLSKIAGAPSTLGQDFLGGVDPFGNWTSQYAAGAQKAGLSDAEHSRKRAVTTAGGLIGGATVVPSTIMGLIEGAKGAGKGKGVAGRLSGAGQGFVRGFKQPIGDLYHGMRASKVLNRAAASKSGVQMNQGQKKSLQTILDKAEVGAVRKQMEGSARGAQGGGSGLAQAQQQMQSAQALRSGMLDKRTAEQLAPTVSEAVGSGAAQLGLGGAIGGLGAYVQYGKGRKAEQEAQQRISSAKTAAYSSLLEDHPLWTEEAE